MVHAEPGTPCTILGYWSDGTAHLGWPAIRGTYRVDGRFPAWVVTEDPTAQMAGGGRIMTANDPSPPRRHNLLRGASCQRSAWSSSLRSCSPSPSPVMR